MKIYCSKCGMAHEVSKSHKNAYMFCLGCDQFFKIDKNIRVPEKETRAGAAPEPPPEETAEAASRKKKLLSSAMLKMQIREILSFMMQKKPSKKPYLP